jgi:hypothetical protein
MVSRPFVAANTWIRMAFDNPDEPADNDGNAVIRRWTARKGWRETDPERGRFFLENHLSVFPNLTVALVTIQLLLTAKNHALAEYIAGIGDQSLFQ